VSADAARTGAERRPGLPPGPYLVVGLARSGTAAARMLSAHGEVIGCDRSDPPEAAALEGVEVHLHSDGLALLRRARTVVKSPGVPRDAPVIVAALERGLQVAGELELAWRLIPNQFVAVTGTNGKTTTVELLGAIHREAGLAVTLAGNVGTALGSLLDPARPSLDPRAVVVCEVSSFQLEDASAFAPECAVLLNIAEDHLDRHRTFGAYRAAKLHVFANQSAGDVAVLPAALRTSLPGVETLRARVVTFGSEEAELAHRDGMLCWESQALMAAGEVRLRGSHNLENAMAAAAAALARGIDPPAVSAALRSFAGVPHRLEEVAEVGGVLFVNDSKATNVSSALRAVEAFDDGIHLILGGSLKGGGFRSLREAVGARCRACYLIGQASEQLAADLEGAAPLHRCGDLPSAVDAVLASAAPGEVVLLSPACASFDQYRDYEARGDHFRALVGALAEPSGRTRGGAAGGGARADGDGATREG
jgi:UDP-N-acetylmuramoylalanine--D-glutamate ligase